ncbi:MAG: histidine phosphatase family protein [Chloroflexota bacterium]|nr:histidine phosphatase family protein [Chloroflexota bacterium]
MGSLFLVRHAPTKASQEGRNLGQGSDPPLSVRGLRLAARLGALLAREVATLDPGAIRLVTSPARRCRQTARAVSAGQSSPPRVEVAAGLIEIDYGRWEGLTAGEAAARDPELRATWEADPFATRTPGGESGADVAARAFPILSEIRGWLEEDSTRCAVVVAHNHVNRLWLTALLGWPMSDYRRWLAQDPAGYSLVEFDGGSVLVHRMNAVPMED